MTNVPHRPAGPPNPKVIEIPKLALVATFASQDASLPFNVRISEKTVQATMYVHVTDKDGNELPGRGPADKNFQLFEITGDSSIRPVASMKESGGGIEVVGHFWPSVRQFTIGHRLDLPHDIQVGQLLQWPFLLVASPAGTQVQAFADSAGATLLSMSILIVP
ncbi:hypothetical protein V4C53_39905 [Paraburkholderia azotifigens]|uniref:hypothetical protein n=1 Tax=Paraburkholderia azotifigens TaxID=2057004 RepID=UPI00317111FB